MKKVYIYWIIGLVALYFIWNQVETQQAQRQAALAANQGSDFTSELEGAGIGIGLSAIGNYFDEGF